MTQDEIIEMAKQAHRKLVTEVYVGHMGQLDPWTIELLKIFAKLVAQHEREACANICETLELPEWPDKVRQPLAQAIRARGQA
jgi:biotin synthase-like enzyme